MNIFHGMARRLAARSAILLMAGLAVPALAGVGAPGMATVVHVTGKVRCSEDHRTWRALKKGERLKPGCLIQTAELSTVDLVLGEPAASGSIAISLDGRHGDDIAQPLANAIRVQQDSVLGLDKLPDGRFGTTQPDETQLDLEAGEILGSVQRMGPDSRYEIKLPKGVAGIHSASRFMLDSTGTARANSGSLIVVEIAPDSSAITKVVSAGHKLDSTSGQVTETSAQEGLENPVKLGADSPRSNAALPQGPSPEFRRNLPSRPF